MEGWTMLDAIVMDMDGTLLDPNNKILPGSLTLANSQNSQMSFRYGFFYVKFLFLSVVCVVYL